MSSNSGCKLFSLNSAHTIPGNLLEEQRVLNIVGNKVNMLREQGIYPQLQKNLVEAVCQTFKTPVSRMVGFVKQREIVKSGIDELPKDMISDIQRELVSREPDITAMQITSCEDFLILGSSAIFLNLESIDIINIVW